MDFARRIGKPEEPPTWKRNGPSFVTTKDKPLSADANSLSEDHRLFNWNKWLAERKKLSRRIESTTNRSQVDQLQSFTNRFRGFVEMKELMEHAAILTVSDKYRSGPEFWPTPQYLLDRDDICLPQISLAPTRKDLNLPPDLTRVALPDLTAKEQSLTALKTKEDSWTRSEYLKIRKHELAEEIVSLLPNEPEMTMLAIRGRTFRKKQTQRRIPPITITESDNEEDSGAKLTKCRTEHADHAVILKIQDSEFTSERSVGVSKTQPVNSDPITRSLTFLSTIDESVEKEIVLENKGTRVIAYHWHWQDSPLRSSNMILEKRDSLFLFNKTKGLVLLGQTVRIKVWYLSRNRGIFTESWRLVTQPRLTSSTFVLRFWGCTIDAKCSGLADHRAIDEYLDRCVRDSAIHTIIENIVSSAQWSDLLEPAYEKLHSPDDLFSSENSSHYYYPVIATQLQEIYRDLANESAQLCDCSLDTLRDILLQTDDTKYGRDRDTLVRFNDLCKQSLRPHQTRFDIVRRSKYDAAYNILCCFANLFKDKSEFVKNNFLTRTYPVIPGTNQRNSSIFSLQVSENKMSEMLLEKEASSNLHLRCYREMFFIHIYKALEDTIERICASIDSYKVDKLNK